METDKLKNAFAGESGQQNNSACVFPDRDLGHDLHSGTLGIAGIDTFGDRMAYIRDQTVKLGCFIKRVLPSRQP